MSEKIQLEFEATTVWKIISAVLGILLIISILTNGFSGSNDIPEAQQQQQIQAPTQQAPEQPEYVDVSADDDAVLGDEDADITIIEFSDYQCPFCARFYTQTLPQLKSNYIDTGKANLVFRDLPLPFHPNARPAAIAAECAEEVGGDYFAYHDKLFTNVDTWSGSADASTQFMAYAKDLDLNEAKFKSCLSDAKIAAEVDADADYASTVGASGTPTFFINGRILVGAQPYAAFQQVIEQELSK